MRNNKKVILTGASRGIGEAAALLLAKKGYDLFLIASRSEEALKSVRDRILAETDVCCECALCDVGDALSCEKVFGEAAKDGVYALINNAGISSYELMTDLSPEKWHHIMEVNLNSCFYTSRLVIPSMLKEKKGKIINISSVWGNVGASMEVAYSAAKGGVNAFTKALAKELAPSNIQVNAAAFGFIDTKMNAHLSAEDKEVLYEEIPAGRAGSAEEAAELIVHILESPEYLTGQIITMDGGWT